MAAFLTNQGALTTRGGRSDGTHRFHPWLAPEGHLRGAHSAHVMMAGDLLSSRSNFYSSEIDLLRCIGLKVAKGAVALLFCF
jgi:hypothetical protein